MLTHADLMAALTWVKLDGDVYTLRSDLLTLSHKWSIRLRSGDWAGQEIRWNSDVPQTNFRSNKHGGEVHYSAESDNIHSGT